MTPEQSMFDRVAIRELIDRYCYAITERDWEAAASCYAEDAVWDVGPPFNMHLEGRAAIVQALTSIISEMDYLVQTADTTMIWLEGDRARATSSIR